MREDLNERLFEACRQGDIALVKELLDRGADINARDRYNSTALMYAIEEGKIDAVEMLIETEEDVNLRDKDGQTLLMCASDFGKKEGGSWEFAKSLN